MKREHKLVWSERYEDEREAVMQEIARVVGLGGSFEIKDAYADGAWHSFITIYYPETEGRTA